MAIKLLPGAKKQLWPPHTSWQLYLTSKFQLILWTEGPNITHKPVTWWDHIWALTCMPIPALDT
jgi:hypothetical protein